MEKRKKKGSKIGGKRTDGGCKGEEGLYSASSTPASKKERREEELRAV